FAAHARLLVAAERVLGINDHGVDRYAAGAKTAGDLVTPLHIGAEHRAAQAVVGVVGLHHRIILVLVGDDRDHGSKNLLLEDLHAGLHIGEDGGLYKKAPVEASRSSAAAGKLGAFAHTRLDVSLDALQLALHRQRTHLRFR